LVYIIVLSWNGKADTLECLQSLDAVDYPNYKVLVVDNASTDGSVAALHRSFPHVEIVVNKSNLRYAGGNNVGIQHALGRNAEYVLLLNNDTVVAPDFLTLLVNAAGIDTKAGMIGPKIYYYADKQRLWYAGGKIEWWKGWISHLGVREIDRGQYDTAGETEFISGCCILIKREVIERIGMLDEAYFLYGEDADWCIRASRSGFKLLFVPAARVWHKLSVSAGGHLSWFKNWNKLKSQLRLLARYAKPFHWITIPAWMIINTVAGYLKSRK
jgi:hypothetical protein